MNSKMKDDVFYVCTLLEYIARVTKNHRGDVIAYFDKEAINRQLKLAEVNHCLSFEQVADELIEEFQIPEGNFDTIAACKYEVPSITAIGRVYQNLVLAFCEDDVARTIRDVFSSFISDEISDFNTNVYYSNPDYLKWSYAEGKLLA